LVLNTEASNHSMLLLRVGGPHPQTVRFVRDPTGHWMADFRVCRRDVYSLEVRSVFGMTESVHESAWPTACTDLHKPASLLVDLFAWDDGDDMNSVKMMECEGLWGWRHGRSTLASNDCLRVQQALRRLHFCLPHPQIKTKGVAGIAARASM